MEDNSWCGLVLAWANRLNLTNQPAQQMIDFTDGKFFAEFMAKHLPSWKTKGQTSTETFSELEVGKMSSTYYNGHLVNWLNCPDRPALRTSSQHAQL